ncbi:M48 family metallopeptidase [Pontibacterium sp. N1Y112]|uniref:M48 family metallopeptidase n=1 Tax=Pontibacterium sinense TaxID=2781979 RepID=A0A8J7FAQ4_9GAMM|nr:M48 family metallopeptidase [Pontibacterium sinense]MBE9396246.1 M48 family metallopeptidase [Pontibacterium sinense]
MSQLKYLNAYPDHLKQQVTQLLKDEKLGPLLLGKYPQQHQVRTDRALYAFTMDLKNDYLRKSAPVSKVIYDDKISVTRDALGLHTQISRVQGNKLKSKNEIRIDSIFKRGPEAFLRMIVVHELAHLREKDHNKAFYKLCEHMEPDYHQLEFDLRLYLTHLDQVGKLY